MSYHLSFNLLSHDDKNTDNLVKKEKNRKLCEKEKSKLIIFKSSTIQYAFEIIIEN